MKRKRVVLMQTPYGLIPPETYKDFIDRLKEAKKRKEAEA
jgi:hypothetical protein